MVLIKSNDRLLMEEEASKIAEAAIEKKAAGLDDRVISSLSSLLRGKWEKALRAKRIVEEQMMKNIRQAVGQYEENKKAAIKQMGGSDVFIGITGTKCRHAVAWLEDTLCQPGMKPWSVEPTPVPELPQETIDEVNSRFIRGAMLQALSIGEQTGQKIDMTDLMSAIQDKLPSLKADVENELREKAKEKAIELEKELDDKLVEGGWYRALSECISDAVIVKNCFLKGPIKRNARVRVREGGRVVVKSKVITQWERRSPFDIYPEPDSCNIQDGYLFDHVAYRRKDLANLIGVEGYSSEEIRAVLREHSSNGLRDWTGIEAQRAEMEGKDVTSVYQSEKIDGLEFYGSISGSALIDAGVSPEYIVDPDVDYDVIVYMIGTHIIKATINEDPYGLKPYSSCGYDMQPDSFWSRALPEKISDAQTICNAAARALVNNIGMGSGPQVEINVDRLSPVMKGDVSIVPWKKWLTTNKMMQTGKAIEFWQANMHVSEIISAYKAFSNVADEHSVPSYAHGDTQVGGAGNTASGLSMLITQAARGIKKVIKNFDDYLIVPSINGVYNELVQDPKYIDRIGDINLIARGSTALIEKEQKAVRMLEFLSATNNPADLQLTGPEGRGYLLEETARAHSIDPDRALPGLKRLKTSAGMMNPLVPVQGEGVGSQPRPENTDLAGNKPQGMADQLFHGGGGKPPTTEGGV